MRTLDRLFSCVPDHDKLVPWTLRTFPTVLPATLSWEAQSWESAWQEANRMRDAARTVGELPCIALHGTHLFCDPPTAR